MKTEKWVPCTKELAENPHKVKAWRNKDKESLRFIAYDKEDKVFPIVTRYSTSGRLNGYAINVVECLIEIPIQERFITFYEGDKSAGAGLLYPSLEFAKRNKSSDCTHILKLTYDGEKFQVEPVWTK